MPPLKFSVIIPTCRREDLLARCLESLRPGAQQDETDSYEVIVTDDAKGKTAEAMMRGQFPWARWVQGPSRGPAANRNNGAHRATGEWLCFIDDDCTASKEWLAALRKAAADESIDLIEGQTIVPDKPDNPFLHGIGNTKGGIYWSCNLAVRRERFVELGGFDEDFLEAASEDMEFAHRYHARHFRSKFYPEALVYHPVRRVGWRNLWNRLFMIRWTALYAYKVDEGLHLSDSPARNTLRALKDTILSLLRRTIRNIRQWNLPYWRERWFTFALRWATFPIILPYYLYWVYRFHGQLSAKQPASSRPGAVEKIAHHRRLLKYVPNAMKRALHPLMRRFYLVDYVLPEKALVQTLVDYLADQPPTRSTAIENVRILAAEEKVIIADPRDDPFVSVGKYYREGYFVRPAIFVCNVPDARLHVGTGMVCTRDWEVVPDFEYRLTDYPEIRRWKPRNVRRLTGTYSAIFTWNGENFGHWMFDCLPRMHSLAKAEPEAKVTMLIPDFLRPALRETFESLLPSNFAVEYHPRDTWLQLENFIWPSLVSGRCNFFLPAEYYDAMRRPIFSRFGLPARHQKTKRIFITRRDALNRRILNEEAVSSLLAKYGFEDHELSRLSFQEQVELFHQADIVIGPHGAGLSSIVFSGDIRLVVLYPIQAPLNHWHTLARGLGQEHHFVLHHAGEDDDFTVDLQQLERVLRDQLGLQPRI